MPDWSLSRNHLSWHSLQHARWVKQLRRLESFSRTKASPATLAQLTHRQREWRAILGASGFPRGFQTWWQGHSVYEPGVPHDLPVDPPSEFLSHMILLHFEGAVAAFEKVLKAQAIRVARANRDQNPRQIFQDIKAARAPLIELLEDRRTTTVVAVDHDDLSLVLHPEVEFAPDRPILTSAGPLDLVHSTPDQLWVHDLLNLQPGARLQQEIHIGNLVELFKMFSQEWSDRWNRHLDLPAGRWQHSLGFIDQHVPYGPVMKYQPISLDEWKDCLRRKKRTAAVGPDGWSRKDLLSLPDDLTSGILAILAEVEAGAPWPHDDWPHPQPSEGPNCTQGWTLSAHHFVFAPVQGMEFHPFQAAFDTFHGPDSHGYLRKCPGEDHETPVVHHSTPSKPLLRVTCNPGAWLT